MDREGARVLMFSSRTALPVTSLLYTMAQLLTIALPLMVVDPNHNSVRL